MNPKNKNQQENWEEKLTQFLLSEEILFENEIGDGWIKISEGKQLTGEYQKIINKVAQLLIQEKAKNRQKFIDGLIWCSGSEDFQVGGKARKGWEKICLPLLRDEK